MPKVCFQSRAQKAHHSLRDCAGIQARQSQTKPLAPLIREVLEQNTQMTLRESMMILEVPPLKAKCAITSACRGQSITPCTMPTASLPVAKK